MNLMDSYYKVLEEMGLHKRWRKLSENEAEIITEAQRAIAQQVIEGVGVYCGGHPKLQIAALQDIAKRARARIDRIRFESRKKEAQLHEPEHVPASQSEAERDGAGGKIIPFARPN